jgi:hypothetical protein
MNVRLRTYALSLMIFGAGLFLATVAINLAIDTQGVFGTGLLGPSLNPNARYQRFVAYETASDRYDGLLFGSSRALDLPVAELQEMGGATFADFAVQFGLITDHLPVLEYVLRDKAAKRERLAAVFLLLDADAFGDQPRTNRFLQTMLAPPLTGEQPLRFWWRYLTAIQVGTWHGEIVRAWANAPPREGGAATPAEDRGPAEATAAPADGLEARGEGRMFDAITSRPDYARQLRLLRQFVALCQGNGVKLTVAVSPLSRGEAAKYDPVELMKVVADVSRIVPVWDFTNSQWMADHQEYWYDSRHFRSELGVMMLARIFGEPAVEVPDDFGRLRAPEHR